MKLSFKLPKERAEQVKAMFAISTGGVLAILYVKGLIWFWNVIPF